jgi:sec-independent protein translocase protein TatC
MARAAAVELTALEHLRELWLRLMGSVVVVFVGGGIAYIFRLQIINFLQRPLNEQLYYTSPMGSFQFIMQLCLLCGVILALPFLIYNILRFIEPAFDKVFSRRFVLAVLGSSLVLAALGVLFGYYLTLPFALQFFNSVGTSSLHALITVNEYFSFILGYLATFAIVFQLPLLLLFINHISPFPPGGLTKWRKHVYIGAFAVSLIMPSSPDPLSQVSLAIPIIALYEVSVALIWYVNRKKHRATSKIQKAQAAREMRNAKLDAIANYTEPTRVPLANEAGEFEDLSDEHFSIAMMQRRMQQREQEAVDGTSPPVAPKAKFVARAAGRTQQQPARRSTPAVSRRPTQFSSREPRLINDVL